MFRTSLIRLSALAALASAFPIHSAITTSSELVPKEITFCNQNAQNPFIVVTFQSEPDFDSDPGSSGLGFWYNSDGAKGLLSLFETAKASGSPMVMTYDNDPTLDLNRWKATASACMVPSQLYTATMK